MKTILFLFTLLTATLTFSQQEMYDICPIKNSEKIPNANIYNTKGEQIDLKKHIGNKPVIIVFYRGGWCPYCMRHLSALGEVKEQIDALGFELMAITPDDYTHLKISNEKSGNLGYQLFSDKDVSAINAFGIGWKINDQLYQKYKDDYDMDAEWWSGSKHHILPVPAVFIAKDGIIQYQYVNPNYSQRLSSDILLAYLKALK